MKIDQIRQLAKEIQPQIVSMRRHLHTHPELSFEEHQTCSFIRGLLDEAGIPCKQLAGTGLVGLIEGSSAGDTVALRADIDALPIQESNNVEYASRHDGVMHACGHDFHTASLMGTAILLNNFRGQFKGTIKLIFQPGEEVIPGGASLMIKEGVLENPRPSAMIGQHAMPRIEAGKIGIKSGKHMASMDSLLVRVIGKGGHGAQPDQNIDPVVIAAHIIVALQQIVSRMANPKEPTVLSFGKVVANGAINVIPDEVHMEGTFRAMNETWRDEAHRRMRRIAERVAESMGGKCEFTIQRGYPFLVNNERLTSQIREDAVEYLGREHVLDEDVWMAAEDFAYYSHAVDSCFYLCGVGNAAKGITSGLHTPTFNIDENVLAISTGLMAYMALRRLGNKIDKN